MQIRCGNTLNRRLEESARSPPKIHLLNRSRSPSTPTKHWLRCMAAVWCPPSLSPMVRPQPFMGIAIQLHWATVNAAARDFRLSTAASSSCVPSDKHLTGIYHAMPNAHTTLLPMPQQQHTRYAFAACHHCRKVKLALWTMQSEPGIRLTGDCAVEHND